MANYENWVVLTLDESMQVNGGANIFSSVIGSVLGLIAPLVGAGSGFINLFGNVLGQGINIVSSGTAQILTTTLSTYLNAFTAV
jgi:hypothetical protein